MPAQITDREQIRTLMDRGAQLVEVLPRKEYEFEHLPGATHLWLRELDDQATRGLDRVKPVIVYCNDFL